MDIDSEVEVHLFAKIVNLLFLLKEALRTSVIHCRLQPRLTIRDRQCTIINKFQMLSHL